MGTSSVRALRPDFRQREFNTEHQTPGSPQSCMESNGRRDGLRRCYQKPPQQGHLNLARPSKEGCSVRVEPRRPRSLFQGHPRRQRTRGRNILASPCLQPLLRLQPRVQAAWERSHRPHREGKDGGKQWWLRGTPLVQPGIVLGYLE